MEMDPIDSSSEPDATDIHSDAARLVSPQLFWDIYNNHM